MFEISIQSYFSSAHNLRDYNGQCEAVHGHNWKVEVFVKSKELNDIGLAIDFKDLKKITKNILSELDHKNLNEIPPFDKINPSSENIARFLFNRIKKEIKVPSVTVSKISVWESHNSVASYFEE
jgi:6-pyruvoyltetrahydropterin/6-carboxytetrahydropterin synthase